MALNPNRLYLGLSGGVRLKWRRGLITAEHVNRLWARLDDRQ